MKCPRDMVDCVLLKFSDSSSYVISLILFSDKRFTKLTPFMKIHFSISNLLHANPTFSIVVHFGWGQHLCKYQIIKKGIALSDFPNVKAKREEQIKKLFKTPSRQDRCLRNFTDWLWKKSYFPAFSSNKVCTEMNAIYACCGNSVDCHHERVVSKTKHSKTKTEARSTQISKTKHPKLENEDP